MSSWFKLGSNEYSSIPDIFQSFFTSNQDVHNYVTRSANLLHIPKIKSDLSKFGISYHGTKIWNVILGLGLNLDVSEVSFKIAIKKHLLNNSF